MSLDIKAELEGTGVCTKHTRCKTRWDLETRREKDQAALCLMDTSYIDRGLYPYLNIVVCLQVLIIGPYSPFLLTSELGMGTCQELAHVAKR